MKKTKTHLKELLTEKLEDYKADFLKLLKSQDERDSISFLHNIQWIDRLQSGNISPINSISHLELRISVETRSGRVQEKSNHSA